MKKIFLFACFIFAAQFLFAGPGTDVMSVNGQVLDKNSNETLSGVKVLVQGTNIVTYTDFDGKFLIPTLPSGTYTLVFDYITYSTQQTITDNQNHCCDLVVKLDQR